MSHTCHKIRYRWSRPPPTPTAGRRAGACKMTWCQESSSHLDLTWFILTLAANQPLQHHNLITQESACHTMLSGTSPPHSCKAKLAAVPLDAPIILALGYHQTYDHINRQLTSTLECSNIKTTRYNKEKVQLS